MSKKSNQMNAWYSEIGTTIRFLAILSLSGFLAIKFDSFVPLWLIILHRVSFSMGNPDKEDVLKKKRITKEKNK